MTDTAYINIRVSRKFKNRYDNALALAKEQTGSHVFNSQVVKRGVEEFIKAAEAGKAGEFLNGL